MKCTSCYEPARCLETRLVKTTNEKRRRYLCGSCGFRFTTTLPAAEPAPRTKETKPFSGAGGHLQAFLSGGSR